MGLRWPSPENLICLSLAGSWLMADARSDGPDPAASGVSSTWLAPSPACCGWVEGSGLIAGESVSFCRTLPLVPALVALPSRHGCSALTCVSPEVTQSYGAGCEFAAGLIAGPGVPISLCSGLLPLSSARHKLTAALA